jgi:cell division transport system permease protein
MNGITFGRVINNGFINYWRNFWLSAAATAIMVITLFIISSLLVLNALASIALSSIQEKVDISVYFKPTTSELTITQIQDQLQVLSQVKSVTYIPSVTARDKFKELHKDEPLLLESVDQFSDSDNPFPASFAIRVNSLADYATIINIFQDQKFQPYVEKITDKRDVVDRLTSITRGVKRIGLGLIAIFSAITLIVMFNTIRLTIYNRREEIEIMRLVGASNWFIRGPFVIEGVFYGLVGALITSGLMYPLIYVLAPKISKFLELDVFSYHYLGLNFWGLLGLQMVTGIVLGVFSSLIVIRRYLKI